MKFELTIDPLAQEDVEEAYRHFEALRSGLGTEFLEALSEILEMIEDHPAMYQKVEEDIRRGLIRRFQYAVFYRILEKKQELVLAIQHTSRQWGRWS